MTALQIVGKINIFSASSSFLSLLYSFANYSCFRERWNGTISHSFTDIMVCICSLFTDMVLRVLVLGYVLQIEFLCLHPSYCISYHFLYFFDLQGGNFSHAQKNC